ncbi:hypothetical protein QJU96_07010 [Pasteurella skyensis]|uniref:Lipoprotein n=1 Tax=Phocoenobacter skyensis TaxID=97481 RepID=A0AAJ6ND82_9PAST|nr:hypothetical protein [Pasteurella skyensis]MDP8171035.1 hypothetical protein [Pasteurella skyensis]MDP8174641.1 hypothetical protein [Pasteurella skyensis]
MRKFTLLAILMLLAGYSIAKPNLPMQEQNNGNVYIVGFVKKFPILTLIFQPRKTMEVCWYKKGKNRAFLLTDEGKRYPITDVNESGEWIPSSDPNIKMKAVSWCPKWRTFRPNETFSIDFIYPVASSHKFSLYDGEKGFRGVKNFWKFENISLK